MRDESIKSREVEECVSSSPIHIRSKATIRRKSREAFHTYSHYCTPCPLITLPTACQLISLETPENKKTFRTRSSEELTEKTSHHSLVPSSAPACIFLKVTKPSTPTGPSASLLSPFSLLVPLSILILALFSPDEAVRYDRYHTASSATFTSFCFYISSPRRLCAHFRNPPVFMIFCALKPGKPPALHTYGGSQASNQPCTVRADEPSRIH